ncbi:MAG: hypothetical protein LBV46_04270 [Bacteroidales bacterium]|jgi:hypothetical protein|nr:hypothetical protein [Bacteroidales bacterium]
MNNIKYLLTLFILLSYSSKIHSQIDSLVNKIAKYNVLESKHVGIAGMTTIQYENFIKLRDTATINELTDLLKHKNPVVKGYAGWALVDKKSSNISDM